MQPVRAAVAVLILGSTVAATGCGGLSSAGETPTRGAPLVVEPVPAFAQPVHTRVAPGDTIESVARRVAGDDWVAWRDALVRELDPRRLQPGVSFRGREAPGGRLAKLVVDLDMRTRLELSREGGEIRCERVERPLDSEVVEVRGTITSSLFGAVESAGQDPELAVRLAEIFQWDIDFFRDLRQGDEFVALVDRQSVDREFFGYGTIFAARFVNAGKTFTAIAYPDDDGRVGYYDLDGRPLRKQFLRSPLKFSRITSRFTMHRFHPVLHRSMPHYGVDYGAPVGTPVHVTADGVVTFVGRKGGGGKMVTVRHPNGYETNYLHLSRYASGVRRGVRVHQGQVIAFTGQTGLATGPHLDYRVRLNGRWVNPLSITSPPAQPIPKDRLARYLSHALAVVAVLDGKEPPLGAVG